MLKQVLIGDEVKSTNIGLALDRRKEALGVYTCRSICSVEVVQEPRYFLLMTSFLIK